MIDLGFNEYGELPASNDEETTNQTQEDESEAAEAAAQEDDPEGEDEADSIEVAI